MICEMLKINNTIIAEDSDPVFAINLNRINNRIKQNFERFCK